MTPEPCLNLAKGSRCRSHMTCMAFGYCRERNMDDPPPRYTTAALIEQRRREANERRDAFKVGDEVEAAMWPTEHETTWQRARICAIDGPHLEMSRRLVQVEFLDTGHVRVRRLADEIRRIEP